MSEPSGSPEAGRYGESNGAEEGIRARRPSRRRRPERLKPTFRPERAKRVMVRKRGFEPLRSFERQPLKLETVKVDHSRPC
jgi:hypothetical protein